MGKRILWRYRIVNNTVDGWRPVEKYGLPQKEGVYDLTIIDGNREIF